LEVLTGQEDYATRAGASALRLLELRAERGGVGGITSARIDPQCMSRSTTKCMFSRPK